MADIVFKYPEMNTSVEAIRGIANQLRANSDTFINDFNSAISAWEGDIKIELTRFVNDQIGEYTGSTIPALINALADLLDANAQQMASADKQIADSIPKSL